MLFTTQSVDADIAANETNTRDCKVNTAMAVGEYVRKIEEVDGKSQRRSTKRYVRSAGARLCRTDRFTPRARGGSLRSFDKGLRLVKSAGEMPQRLASPPQSSPG